MREFWYCEIADDFVEEERDNGNRVVVTGPDEDRLDRYALHVDDFGYVMAALVRLFIRLGLKTDFPEVTDRI